MYIYFQAITFSSNNSSNLIGPNSWQCWATCK